LLSCYINLNQQFKYAVLKNRFIDLSLHILIIITAFGQPVKWIVGTVNGLVHFSLLHAQCLDGCTGAGRHRAIVGFIAVELQVKLVGPDMVPNI
jgi:hypothetical protein